MEKRYLRAPVVLMGVAVGVILLAFLLLRFGPNHTAVRLEEPEKAAEFVGFTLHGDAGDSNYTQHFLLKDGALKSTFSFKSIESIWKRSNQSGWANHSYAVAPAKAKEVDSTAINRGNEIYSSKCDSFQTMIEVVLPDGTMARFCYGAPIQFSQPISVTSNPGKFYSPNIFLPDGPMPEYEALPVSGNTGAFQYDGKTFVFVSGTPDTPAAIYEVISSIAYDAIQKLPKDGTLGGKGCLLPTTPYGEVKKITEYPVGTYLSSATSAQGLIAVGLVCDGKISIDLLHPDGSRAQSVETQMELPDSGITRSEMLPGTISVSFPPTSTEDEICFVAMDSTNPFAHTYGALRVKDGKVVATCFAKSYGDATPNEIGDWDTNDIEAMTLSENNDAILVAKGRARVYPDGAGQERHLESGVVLSAYRSGESKPYAYNVLVCNQEEDSIVLILYPPQQGLTFMRGNRRFFSLSNQDDPNGFLYFRF